jgi:hypothetical protein
VQDIDDQNLLHFTHNLSLIALQSSPSLGVDGRPPDSADQTQQAERPVQDVSRFQNGMQYGGRGGRRGWQQQRAPVNEIYLPNARYARISLQILTDLS